MVVTKEEALQLFAGNPFKQARPTLIASKLDLTLTLTLTTDPNPNPDPNPDPEPDPNPDSDPDPDPFKALITSKLPEGSSTTVYQNGPFVDLCKGPHIANTSRVKAFVITKNSASLWLSKQGNDQLQRVYGISFPDKKEFAEWKHFQEQAAKRDHRKIGLEQELYVSE